MVSFLYNNLFAYFLFCLSCSFLGQSVRLLYIPYYFKYPWPVLNDTFDVLILGNGWKLEKATQLPAVKIMIIIKETTLIVKIILANDDTKNY